jgi:hypothetical protein
VSLSDGAAFASPVYMGDITAQLRGFAERLMYPFHSFDAKRQCLAPKRLETAVIYTMNVGESVLNERYIGPNGDGPLGFFEKFLESTFSNRSASAPSTPSILRITADMWPTFSTARQRPRAEERSFPKTCATPLTRVSGWREESEAKSNQANKRG